MRAREGEAQVLAEHIRRIFGVHPWPGPPRISTAGPSGSGADVIVVGAGDCAKPVLTQEVMS
jgi:hypothetical protein